MGCYVSASSTNSEIIGDTDISNVGDGTLSGAVAYLKNNMPVPVRSFYAATDEELGNMLNAYYIGALTWEQMGWQVGDYRIIHLDAMQAPKPNSSQTWAAQDIAVQIVAHDHTDLATSIGGKTKACITVQTREVLSGASAGTAGTIYSDGSASPNTSFKPWSSLYIRTYLNSTVWGAFPSAFKSLIKPSANYRHTSYNTTAASQIVDNLFIPSYPEYFGTSSYSYYTATNPTEGSQFEYYANGGKQARFPNNNGQPYDTGRPPCWTGSSGNQYTSTGYYSWMYVGSYGGGEPAVDYGMQENAIAPAFAM